MADWFKFYNNGLDAAGLQYCISEQPLVTSVWLVILSEASKNRACRFPWGGKDFQLLGYARKVNISPAIFNQCLSLLEHAGYIKRHSDHIDIPGWDKLQSDYAKGLDKGYYKNTSKKLASNSEVSSPRREEIRVEETKENPNSKPGGNGVLELIPNGHTNEWKPTPEQLRLGALFKRRAATRWDSKEIKSWRAITPVDEADLKLLETYYAAKIPKDSDYRRHDLATLLNNFNGELDRARKYKPQNPF